MGEKTARKLSTELHWNKQTAASNTLRIYPSCETARLVDDVDISDLVHQLARLVPLSCLPHLEGIIRRRRRVGELAPRPRSGLMGGEVKCGEAPLVRAFTACCCCTADQSIAPPFAFALAAAVGLGGELVPLRLVVAAGGDDSSSAMTASSMMDCI